MVLHRHRLAVMTILIGAAVSLGQDATSLPGIRVNVDVVRVPVSATQHGIPVKGLTKDVFQLREDSTPQVVQYFWQESDLPLSIGLIVDVSPSQAGLIGKHKETVTKFLHEVLGPQDRAMLITVGSQARLVGDFTASIDEFAKAIDRIKLGNKSDPILGEPCRGTRARRHLLANVPCGGTALWQGVYWAAKLKMKSVEGRKALIILSDGMDTGSDRSLEDAIEAAQAAETPVYTIKYVSPVALGLAPVAALRHGMEKLSGETGGEAYGILHGDIRKVFQQIEDGLRNLYVLGYSPANPAHDGTFRKIEVTNSAKGVQLRTRKGYLAVGE